MSLYDNVEKMKNIYSNILEFLDNEANLEENFQNIQNNFDEQNIKEDKHELRILLHLIVKLSNNHYRKPNFFNKIDQILQLFKDEIKKNYTNREIFNIIKGNKRILLFFIEEKLITIDVYITNEIITKRYHKYFASEIQSYIKEQKFPTTESKLTLPVNFYENRKIGENNDELCVLIRNDSIKEFIVYVNKNNVSLSSTIKPSIYETNSFLLKKQSGKNKISLIEYAAFFGSIQIFNYLKSEGCNLNQHVWKFAIHGQNTEIIQNLEEVCYPKNELFDQCLFDSIKCHHNEIVNYFQYNFTNAKLPKKQDILYQIMKNYNFILIEKNLFDQSLFECLCKYDYYNIVDMMLQNSKIPENIDYAFLKAIKNENIDIIKLLMTQNIDINAKSEI